MGLVPRTMDHYIENIGPTPSDSKYKDISLNQWIALTPPALVRGISTSTGHRDGAFRRDPGLVVR